MRRIILVVICILLSPFSCSALTITHPQRQNLAVCEDRIFFSGKIEKYESVKINGVPIFPEKMGAFSYSVKLNEGENIFAVQKKNIFLDTKTVTYTITRYNPIHNEEFNKFIKQMPSYYYVNRNNVVLRETPVDAGINRLGYLPKGTKLFVDGKFNEFSRVYLTKDKYGWVFTKDLSETELNMFYNSEEIVYKPKRLINKERIKTGNDTTYIFTLTEDIPYSAVVEDNQLIVTLFNLDNDEEMYRKVFDLDSFPRYSICMKNGMLYVCFKKNPFEDKIYTNRAVKIVIDAGHGGSETGAIGCLGDKEKDLNLEVALKLKNILEQAQFNVSMTREYDKDVSLKERTDFAKEADALVFISIHLNSVPISSNPNLNSGSIVFYYNPQSEALAQELSKTVSKYLGTQNGGSSQASFAVIRPTEYIGVLVELAYLVNPKDVRIYKSKDFTQNSAEAIYKGLINYLHSQLDLSNR